jgi:rhodanese-related sulfurtransferase
VAVLESQTKTVRQMVAEAKGRVESLSVEQAAAEIGGDVTLVDVREDDERFLEGAIPRSVHVPRGMLELSADPESPLHRKEFGRDRRVILYCSSGSRSALGADTMRGMGYENVVHLHGGRWRGNGADAPWSRYLSLECPRSEERP